MNVTAFERNFVANATSALAAVTLAGLMWQRTSSGSIIVANGKKKTKDPKVILITGALLGIGKATALKILEQSHIVHSTAGHIDQMQELLHTGGHTVAINMVN